jgi:hypothetical protein
LGQGREERKIALVQMSMADGLEENLNKALLRIRARGVQRGGASGAMR